MKERYQFARILNVHTMMWERPEFVSIPDEQMPRAGDHIVKWFEVKDRFEKAVQSKCDTEGT